MSEFEKAFLDRHGEIGVLPIIENWERSRGIRNNGMVPFEDRWMAFLQATAPIAMAA
ncbi:MAG: hypothetical protein PHX43_01075 [Alphaproteobacteria bacterium]|nr:hypothetical protein [Alphaproteobacteria bacterium]